MLHVALFLKEHYLDNYLYNITCYLFIFLKALLIKKPQRCGVFFFVFFLFFVVVVVVVVFQFKLIVD